MAFYDLSKEERRKITAEIEQEMLVGVRESIPDKIVFRFAHEDTYIRKEAYRAAGKIYFGHKELRLRIIQLIEELLGEEDHKIRQTAVNAAGEIGKKDFAAVEHLFDKGLFDPHHTVRNAVIGSVKKMAEVNPGPVLKWAEKYLHHEDKEVRREIVHGIELRGRKCPEDILPLLQELEHEKTSRVRKTLIHVLGQISYKKGCLETVVSHLKQWENKELVAEALEEILDVHDRYRDFAALSRDEAQRYIENYF